MLKMVFAVVLLSVVVGAGYFFLQAMGAKVGLPSHPGGLHLSNRRMMRIP